MRNFIRKWGHAVKHDPLMKPIIPPKYNIGFIVKDCDFQTLAALEPWCDQIYVELAMLEEYIALEQKHTTFNLEDRIQPYKDEKTNNILVKINGRMFTQQDSSVIQNLSEILQDSGEIGEFNLGNLKITINSLETYEKELICAS